VTRVIFFIFYFDLGGPKLLQMQNLGGRFVVFFRSQNHNFVKVKRLKLQLNQITIIKSKEHLKKKKTTNPNKE